MGNAQIASKDEAVVAASGADTVMVLAQIEDKWVSARTVDQEGDALRTKAEVFAIVATDRQESIDRRAANKSTDPWERLAGKARAPRQFISIAPGTLMQLRDEVAPDGTKLGSIVVVGGGAFWFLHVPKGAVTVYDSADKQREAVLAGMRADGVSPRVDGGGIRRR